MERAGFLNAMNNAAHQMITVGIWPSMETILGPSWRSTDSDDQNWGASKTGTTFTYPGAHWQENTSARSTE